MARLSDETNPMAGMTLDQRFTHRANRNLHDHPYWSSVACVLNAWIEEARALDEQLTAARALICAVDEFMSAWVDTEDTMNEGDEEIQRLRQCEECLKAALAECKRMAGGHDGKVE